MSRMKEPQYFAPHLTRWNEAWGQGNAYPEPGIGWYLKLFAEAGEVRYAGESSVSYTARPWVVDCEKRIYKFNPQAKLIYLMRDPVERAVSHYWYFVNDGREDRSMLDAFKAKEEYVSRSDYYRQLKPYFDTFGSDQIFTLTLEELNHSPDETFSRLFTWLGVNPEFRVASAERFNVSKTKLYQTRRHRVFLDTMMKHWRWKQHEHRIPGFIINGLKSLTYRPVDKSKSDTASAIEHIRPILLEKTEPLLQLLGRRFPEWETLYQSQNPAHSSPSTQIHSDHVSK